MSAFDRQSETYSHLGNISAQGVQRLLGTPSIDRLQTVIRESVQNSWDAAFGRSKPQFHVHLRALSDSEMNFLQRELFSDIVPEGTEACLSEFLDKRNPLVLELSDYGTSGLGGPTDASVITESDEDTDFVDFVRNIGTPRDTAHGGGTYGYGKSSLYSLSKCATIVVDSLTTHGGKEERRFIACRVAESFVRKSGQHRGKYTGRHWWGKHTRSGRLDPLKGSAARSAALKLGCSERLRGDLGTSILILDPDLDEAPDIIINGIQRALLWNFWPKLVRYERHGSSMRFRTLLNGQEIILPALQDCPPLNLFEKAIRRLKADEAISIESARPARHLGLMQIEKGIQEPRLPGFEADEDGMFPDNACHVALMRPAELVVKYLTGNTLPSGAEWGGLFICSEEHEIEQAFAEAEPPAHDDWIPKYMPRGNKKTYVNVALREVKKNMEQAVTPGGITASSGHAQLAKLSSKMGALLAGSVGDGMTKDKPAGRRKQSRTAKSELRIRDLDPWGPDEWEDGEVLAWFTFRVESTDVREIKLSGTVKVYIDGELTDSTPDGETPEIRVWADHNESLLGYGEYLVTTTDKAELIWVGISIPGEAALSFAPEVHGA